MAASEPGTAGPPTPPGGRAARPGGPAAGAGEHETLPGQDETLPGEPGTPAGGPARRHVSNETIRSLEASMSSLGTAAMASMDRRLPWFRRMSAENRSWLGRVA